MKLNLPSQREQPVVEELQFYPPVFPSLPLHILQFYKKKNKKYEFSGTIRESHN